MPKLTPEELEAKAAAWHAHVDRLFAARNAERAKATLPIAWRPPRQGADARLEAIKKGMARRQALERSGLA